MCLGSIHTNFLIYMSVCTPALNVNWALAEEMSF